MFDINNPPTEHIFSQQQQKGRFAVNAAGWALTDQVNTGHLRIGGGEQVVAPTLSIHFQSNRQRPNQDNALDATIEHRCAQFFHDGSQSQGIKVHITTSNTRTDTFGRIPQSGTGMEPFLNPILQGKPPQPLLVVISGPSGVGKDSVLMRMRELGFPFHFVVTANSRPQRPGEIDGVDYHFVTTERFREMIENDELLEWAEVYGQYKGIPKFEIRQAMASGRDVILRINVDGAATIKRLAPEAVFIFLAPASLDELRHRLLLRRTESPAEVERRLAMVADELAQLPNFDYVVINHADRLDEAVGQIRAIISAEKARVYPRRISL